MSGSEFILTPAHRETQRRQSAGLPPSGFELTQRQRQPGAGAVLAEVVVMQSRDSAPTQCDTGALSQMVRAATEQSRAAADGANRVLFGFREKADKAVAKYTFHTSDVLRGLLDQ